MTAAPPGAAPQGEAAPSVEASAARDQINSLRGDKAFLSKFAAGDAEARATMRDLHIKGWPDAQTGHSGPGVAPTLVGGFEKKAGPGDPAHEGDEAAPLDTSLPFEFAPDVSVNDMKAMHKLGQEIVTNLEIDPQSASGHLKMLNTAINARPKDADGVPLAMHEAELAKMEFILKETWRDDYEANTQAFHAALQKAGPKGGEWLRRAILASGPTAAVWAMNTLIRKQV